MPTHQRSRRRGLRLGLGALGTAALCALVALMYAAFVWRACEVQGLDQFLSAFRAFHTGAGC